MIILIIHTIVSYDQNISKSIFVKMDSMSGFEIRLVFTFPPKDTTLQYKKCVHLWNNFPCISTLWAIIFEHVKLNGGTLEITATVPFMGKMITPFFPCLSWPLLIFALISHIFLLFRKTVYLLLFKHVFSTYEKLGPKASVKNWICYQLKPDECPVSFSLTIHLNPPCKDDNSQL